MSCTMAINVKSQKTTSHKKIYKAIELQEKIKTIE